jgi:uncharacterized protein YifE (UPF0438 family)
MHVYRPDTSTSTEHEQARQWYKYRYNFEKVKRINHLSSNETFVLFINSIPRYEGDLQ